MNKRGIFFVVLAMVIISIFLVSIAFYSAFINRESVQRRVETLDNFVFAIEEDLPRQIYINGFRTIFILENEIIESGAYASNIQSVFQEAFFNGTVHGQPEVLLNGATFGYIESSIQQKAAKINAEVSLQNPILDVSQKDPWNIAFTLNATFLAEDKAGVALWNKTISLTANVPVESFNDPLYLVNTNGVIANKIIQTNQTPFVSGGDVSNLSAHTQNSYYIALTSAPSFLKRLEGDFSADANGVESLVNLNELANQGLQVYSKSAVDYIYFSQQNPLSCNVLPAGMPSWFRLDDAHLTTYGVSCAG